MKTGDVGTPSDVRCIRMLLNLLLACLLTPSALILAAPTATLYGGAKVTSKPITTNFATQALAYNKYGGSLMGGLGNGGGLYAGKAAFGGMGLLNPMSYKAMTGFGKTYAGSAMGYNPFGYGGAYPTLGNHFNAMASSYPSAMAGYGKYAGIGAGMPGGYYAGKMMGGYAGGLPLAAGQQMTGYSAGPGHLAQQMVNYGPGFLSKQSLQNGPGFLSQQSLNHGPGFVSQQSLNHGPGFFSQQSLNHGPGFVSQQSVKHGPGFVTKETVHAGPGLVASKQTFTAPGGLMAGLMPNAMYAAKAAASPLYGSFGMLGKSAAFTPYGAAG